MTIFLSRNEASKMVLISDIALDKSFHINVIPYSKVLPKLIEVLLPSNYGLSDSITDSSGLNIKER